jgi:hypothetical protein
MKLGNQALSEMRTVLMSIVSIANRTNLKSVYIYLFRGGGGEARERYNDPNTNPVFPKNTKKK